MLKTHLLVAASALSLASAGLAAPPRSDSPLMLAQSAAQSTTSPMVNGEVRKVDKDAGKITLKHDAIPNLEMPRMTMVFRVKDPSMLDQLKEGDKIKFAADNINGALTVTELQANK
jgi:Cu(I)/Ag(I) efflux system periplasmic protein CusF